MLLPIIILVKKSMNKNLSNKNKELISIISPVYNNSHHLPTCIESVLSQNYDNWELILIDDCSNDESKHIIELYQKKDSRIKGLFLKENVGAGKCRNIGIDYSTGDYLAFLDSDDYWHEEKLEKHVMFVKKHNYSFSYTAYTVVNEKGEGRGYFKVPKKLGYKQLTLNNYILTSTVLVKRSFLSDTRFEAIRTRQDWILFLELLKKGEYSYGLNDLLTNYRISGNSLSSNKLKLIIPNFVVFNKYVYNKSFLKSTVHFVFFLFCYSYNKIFNYKK